LKFLIILIAACLVFAFCFAVFLFKARKGEAPRLHTCGHGDSCHCYGPQPQKHPQPHACAHDAGCLCAADSDSAQKEQFDLIALLKKAKSEE
jgi:hypothetical protein